VGLGATARRPLNCSITHPEHPQPRLEWGPGGEQGGLAVPAAGTGAGGTLGWGLRLWSREGTSHARDINTGTPWEQPPGVGQNLGAQGRVPTGIGKSDPIPASRHPSCCPGHRGWVWMWHPKGRALYFGGGNTCAPRQLPRGAGVCLAGKGLTPWGFRGAGVSPAGHTQAAPCTADLTPLPWQRLMKSPVPTAGRLPRAWGDAMGVWEGCQAPSPLLSPPLPPHPRVSPE